MIWVREERYNATENYWFGDTGVYESRFETPGEVYRASVKKFGRCIGKICVDDNSGKSRHIGWVFQKREKYDDCDETFILQTVITLHSKKSVTIIKYFYLTVEERDVLIKLV